MTLLPSVIRAVHRGGFRIRVLFDDGTEKTVDFKAWLNGPVFEPLKDPAYFRRFFVDGGTVAWPNGADIAPETLYGAKDREATPSRGVRSAQPRPQPGKASQPRARNR